MVTQKHFFFYNSQTPGISKKRNNGFKRTRQDLNSLVEDVVRILPTDKIIVNSKKLSTMEKLRSYRQKDSVFYKIANEKFSEYHRLVARHSKLLYYTYISNMTEFHQKYLQVGGSFDNGKSKKIKKKGIKVKKVDEIKDLQMKECGNIVENGANDINYFQNGAKVKGQCAVEQQKINDCEISLDDGANTEKEDAFEKQGLTLSLKCVLGEQENIGDLETLLNTVVEVAGVKVGRDSLESLLPNQQLTDTAIDVFSLIFQNISNSFGSQIYYFDTACMQYICNGSIPNFEGWENLPHLNQSKLWLMPVNERGDHWTLYVINFDEKKIIYCNSLMEEPEDVETENLCAFLKSFCTNEKFDREEIEWSEWILIAPNDLPPQRRDVETNNCGLHVLILILIICTRTVFNFNDDLITTIVRHNFLTFLTSNSFDDLTDRTELNNILLNFDAPKKKLKKKRGKKTWTKKKKGAKTEDNKSNIPCKIIYESLGGNSLNYLSNIFNL